MRREIRRGSRFGDRSGQIRLRLRQTLQYLWPRDMERLRRKCAVLGLLDRATKLTAPQGEKREYLDPRLQTACFRTNLEGASCRVKVHKGRAPCRERWSLSHDAEATGRK